MMYLPEAYKEIEKLPRSYVANVAYTVIGDDFKKWVDDIIEEDATYKVMKSAVIESFVNQL